jgi:hypothetical protein
VWRQVRDQAARAFPVVPFRADRTYGQVLGRSAARTQLIHNCQLFLDRAEQHAFFERLEALTEEPAEPAVPPKDTDPGERSLDGLLAGLRLLCPRGIHRVDVTTPDVRALGFSVVRVVAPDMIPNMPDGLPPRRVLRHVSGDSLPADWVGLPHA